MADSLTPIKRAIRAGDQARARRLLKPVLQDEPSADAWTLAAMVTETNDQAIKCLRKALAIDEWHSEANRMLSRLEKVGSLYDRGYQYDTGFRDELKSAQQDARQQGQFLNNFVKGFGRLFKRQDDKNGNGGV